MPRVSDLLVGLGTGALSEVNERRKSRQDMADKIALAEAEAKIKQRHPSAGDLLTLSLLRQMGLPVGNGGAPSPTTPPVKTLPSNLEAEIGVPGTIAVPGPDGSVILGEGESSAPTLSRGDLLRRFGTVAPSTPGVPTVTSPFAGFQPESISRGGVRLTNPEAMRAASQARAEGLAAGTPLSPDQEAKLQGFEDLLRAVNAADTLLAHDPGFKGQLFATGLPFQPGAGDLADELKNAADILLRLRSGAAINEDEYKRLRSLLPTGMTALSELAGNPNRARNQLARFRQTAQELLSTKRLKSGERVSTSSVGRGNGQMMTDAQGNRAIVYSDGSFEELP